MSDETSSNLHGDLSAERAADVHQFVMENPDVTPDEVLNILELDERFREDVEKECALVRHHRSGASHGSAFNDEGLNWENVEWSDVEGWPVAKSPDWA